MARFIKKSPPQLALRIFLGICSHEIEHIKRFLVPPVHNYEKEADKGVLDKHAGAMYVYFETQNIGMCYGAVDLDPATTRLLVPDETKRTNTFSTRRAIFNESSKELYHHLYPESEHPSDKERAEYFKSRNEEARKQPKKSSTAKQECAQIAITTKEFFFPIVSQLEVCESFEVNEID